MANYCIHLINATFWIFMFITGSAASASYDDVTSLIDTIFRNYSIHVRPVYNQSKPVVAHVSFTLRQIEDLNIKTQVMNGMGFFSVNWTDEYLTWNPNDFGGVTYITIPEKKIWTPDYVIDNRVTTKGSRLGDDNHLVLVRSNGQILWEPEYMGSSICPMDITFFPFDKQICKLVLLSWMTSNSRLQTIPTTHRTISTDHAVENGEFEITDTSVERFSYYLTFSDKETLEGIRFSLMLSRRPAFYWLSLLAPVLAFPFLSPLSFLVSVESGEKTTVSITALLSVFVFLGIIYDTMPKLSNNLSYFVLLVTIQVLISLLTVVCNVVLKSIQDLPQSRPIPTWILALAALARNRCPTKETKPLNQRTPSVSDEYVLETNPDKITWQKIACYLNSVCFYVSLFSVTFVSLVFAILMSLSS